jgi:hypothetical protein
MLSASAGNILDDEELINTLAQAKVGSFQWRHAACHRRRAARPPRLPNGCISVQACPLVREDWSTGPAPDTGPAHEPPDPGHLQ